MTEIIEATIAKAVVIQYFVSSHIEGFFNLGLLCIYTIPLCVRFANIAEPNSLHLTSTNPSYSNKCKSKNIELRLYAFMHTLPMFLKNHYPTSADYIIEGLKKDNIWKN